MTILSSAFQIQMKGIRVNVIHIYAPMPVKMCHHPCSSRINPQGRPMERLVAVRDSQIELSIHQSTKPVPKFTASVGLPVTVLGEGEN
jgi:hypothetical protein